MGQLLGASSGPLIPFPLLHLPSILPLALLQLLFPLLLSLPFTSFLLLPSTILVPFSPSPFPPPTLSNPPLLHIISIFSSSSPSIHIVFLFVLYPNVQCHILLLLLLLNHFSSFSSLCTSNKLSLQLSSFPSILSLISSRRCFVCVRLTVLERFSLLQAAKKYKERKKLRQTESK